MGLEHATYFYYFSSLSLCHGDLQNNLYVSSLFWKWCICRRKKLTQVGFKRATYNLILQSPTTLLRSPLFNFNFWQIEFFKISIKINLRGFRTCYLCIEFQFSITLSRRPVQGARCVLSILKMLYRQTFYSLYLFSPLWGPAVALLFAPAGRVLES